MKRCCDDHDITAVVAPLFVLVTCLLFYQSPVLLLKNIVDTSLVLLLRPANEIC